MTYLARDRFGGAIGALKPGTNQTVTFTDAASTEITNALAASTLVVRLAATGNCYVAIGPSASVDASSAHMVLPSGWVEYVRVDQNAGLKVSVRGLTGASGSLSVTEMA